jgi:hypothetical protein
MPKEPESLMRKVNEHPSADAAAVEHRADGHVVVVAGRVVAGPFRSNESAWHWIDRTERYEPWQRRSRWA